VKRLAIVWRFAAAMVAGMLVLVVALGVIGGAEPSASRTQSPTAEGTQAPTDNPARSPIPGVSPSPTAEPTAMPTFAEECSTALRPEWGALFTVGDPGYGLDSDFLGDLRQVSVANGLCTITAERASTPSGRPFVSAAMSTKGGFAQRYGTFEIRVRYPDGQGVWPAFWLLRQQEAVATPPEIDVFEAYPRKAGLDGRGGLNVVVSTLHYAGGSHTIVYRHGSDMTADFHVHRLVWSPGLLVFSVDGVETGRISSDVPDVPMYPIISLALGAAGYRTDVHTPAIARMEVDYLRVWAN
jgi:hypothetical protein